MNELIAFISGVVFALGLGISGMADPRKVIGFLDITGNWDPTLAFVMAGAVATYYVGQRLILKRPHPVFDSQFHVPTHQEINRPLIAGAALFGVGWGLSGYCPGPALVALATLRPEAGVFVLTMLIGMAFFKWRETP